MPEHEVSTSSGGPQKKMISRYADTVGDGSGTKNFNGDYTTPDQAIFAAGAKEDYVISRLIISVGDTTSMQAQEYGNLAAALGNGVEVKHIAADGSTVLNDLTDGVPITTNAEWAQLCYDADVKTWGAGDELLVVRWTFAKAGQQGINLSAGESLRVFLSDDLQGLTRHYFMFQGFHSYLFD